MECYLFYSTNDESATVYTARSNDNDDDYIDWALHEFSNTVRVKQVRNGCFEIPYHYEPAGSDLQRAYLTRSSYVMLEICDVACRKYHA
jgi:hypothetical protein